MTSAIAQPAHRAGARKRMANTAKAAASRVSVTWSVLLGIVLATRTRACACARDPIGTSNWKANTHEEGQRGVGQAANVAGILCAVHL